MVGFQCLSFSFSLTNLITNKHNNNNNKKLANVCCEFFYRFVFVEMVFWVKLCPQNDLQRTRLLWYGFTTEKRIHSSDQAFFLSLKSL